MQIHVMTRLKQQGQKEKQRENRAHPLERNDPRGPSRGDQAKPTKTFGFSMLEGPRREPAMGFQRNTDTSSTKGLIQTHSPWLAVISGEQA